jgi:hypothetical protein
VTLLDARDAGTDYTYTWPSGDPEVYRQWIDYRAITPDGEHDVRIGFGERHVYGSDRKRVVVWIDSHPHAEFLGADDFDVSGEVLSEIKLHAERGEPICRYGADVVPERYSGLRTVGLKTRVSGPGVHDAWAVVTSIGDHLALAQLAALRRLERLS